MSLRLTTIEEFYLAVDELIAKLRADNYQDDANRLHELLHQMAWTTSSELMGELKLAFKSMQGKYPVNLRDEISVCLKFTANHRKILGLG